MVTLLAATAGGFAWPSEPPTRPPRPVDQAVVKPEDIVVFLDRETLIEQNRPEDVNGAVVPRTRISAVINAYGQTDAVLLSGAAIDSHLTFWDQTVSDRMVFPSPRLSGPLSSTRKNTFQLARQVALGPLALLVPPFVAANPFGRTTVATLPADLAERHKGEPVILNGTVTFQAHRYRVPSVVLARPGARFAFPGSAIEITSVSVSPTGAAIGFREAEVHSLVSFTARFMPEYYLRNTARHEAFQLEVGRASIVPLTLSRMVTVMTGTWQLRSNSYALTGSRIDAAWLAGSELVRLELEGPGTFTRPLHAEFTLKK